MDMIADGADEHDEQDEQDPHQVSLVNQPHQYMPTASSSSYGQLDLSVGRPHRPNSKTPSPQRKPSLPTVLEERSEDGLSLSRRSSSVGSSTGSTITGDRRSWNLEGYQQTLQFLPTIDSGEPLTWDEPTSHEDDPFTDSAVTYNAAAHPRTYFPPYEPERPQSTSSSSTSRPLPSRPQSTNLHVPAQDENPHYYQTPTRLLSGNSPVDHFRYDTEAYASGTYSRASYQPQSRSPTPAVDDEDYRLSGHSSVHYTGVTNPSEYEDQDYYTQDVTTTSQDMYTEDGEEYEDGEEEDDEEDGEEDEYDEDDEEEDEYDDGAEKVEHNFAPFRPRHPVVPVTTMHFGPAPSGRVHRRHKKRRVQLTNGNLLVDLSVPPKLILPLIRSDRETSQTRYTAITCDPDEFEKNGFFLKQNERHRSTELFICVTVECIAHIKVSETYC